MENTQTAVQYLIEKMSQYNFEIECVRDKYFPIAMQIEKEHINRAYQEGLIDGMNHSPKDYYNKTYNK
jgi:hypothetical protein